MERAKKPRFVFALSERERERVRKCKRESVCERVRGGPGGISRFGLRVKKQNAWTNTKNVRVCGRR